MGDEILRALLEVVPAPLLIVDALRQFLYVNPAACELFGRRPEDLLGMDLADCIVPRERDEITSYLRSGIPHEPARRSMRVLRPDGLERDVIFPHDLRIWEAAPVGRRRRGRDRDPTGATRSGRPRRGSG